MYNAVGIGRQQQWSTRAEVIFNNSYIVAEHFMCFSCISHYACHVYAEVTLRAEAQQATCHTAAQQTGGAGNSYVHAAKLVSKGKAFSKVSYVFFKYFVDSHYSVVLLTLLSGQKPKICWFSCTCTMARKIKKSVGVVIFMFSIGPIMVCSVCP